MVDDIIIEIKVGV